jgi:hypothetical protein
MICEIRFSVCLDAVENWKIEAKQSHPSWKKIDKPVAPVRISPTRESEII